MEIKLSRGFLKRKAGLIERERERERDREREREREGGGERGRERERERERVKSGFISPAMVSTSVRR